MNEWPTIQLQLAAEHDDTGTNAVETLHSIRSGRAHNVSNMKNPLAQCCIQLVCSVDAAVPVPDTNLALPMARLDGRYGNACRSIWAF